MNPSQPLQTTLRVRYQETDQMRVVYYANYLVWFEVGRTEFIRERGFTYGELEEKGLLLPVVDVQCRYEHPARYGDEIIIETQIVEQNKSKISFAYQVMRKKDSQRLATGRTIHIWTDRQMKRVNIQKVHPTLYQCLHSIDEG